MDSFEAVGVIKSSTLVLINLGGGEGAAVVSVVNWCFSAVINHPRSGLCQ